MQRESKIYWALLLFCFIACSGQKNVTSIPETQLQEVKPGGRIAVAAVSDSENSEISSIAGRAPWFLIFDEKGNFMKSVINPGAGMGGGASRAVTDLLVKENCKIMVAGQFGYKMENQLKANKIDFFERKGNAKKVVQHLINSF
jgi:predicted Fe-Mo cluster-binding NifX family protein